MNSLIKHNSLCLINIKYNNSYTDNFSKIVLKHKMQEGYHFMDENIHHFRFYQRILLKNDQMLDHYSIIFL